MKTGAADCLMAAPRLISRATAPGAWPPWRALAREFCMPLIPIDRREFLRGTAALGALPFAGAGRALAAEAELVARKVFFDNPDVGSVRISPDGETLSWLAPVDNVRNLWVAPRENPGAARAVTHATDRNLSNFYRWGQTSRHLVFLQEHDGDENWRASSVDIASGATVLLTPERGVQAYLQESDRKFPEEMLIKHNARDKRYSDLFRVNIVTGKSEMVFENNQFAWYITDSDFQVRLGIRYAADGSAEWLERRGDGSFASFITVPIADTEMTEPLDFSADGRTFYMLDARGRDKAALFAVDTATRKATLLAEDDEADIVHVDFDDELRHPIAVKANKDRVRWQEIDPGAAQDMADLAKYGPGDVEVTKRSTDSRFATAFYQRDTESGEYVLLDRQTRKVRSLFRQSKALADVKLQKLQPVIIPARDGLRLNGYLTLPDAEAGSGKLPMVLLIHGGPYARDSWGFNSIHQWLANRGYAVLSVNYRGSTGFGKAFVTAADKEWGGRMHDDLIDAVDWAVAQGVADPKRIGFFGGSYGGYSALMAATKTPEVFACIVDVFGISNLITFMATIPPYWGPWFSIWKNRLADPATEEGRAFLIERSPLTHIDRVVRPLLIAQGARDVRVVAAESEQMVAALKNRGVPVTYITFPDEGHGFARPENRLAFYAAAESFLAKHLGGRAQSVGDDMLAKVFSGQEAHGAPPGFYLALFWVTFWPGSVLAGLAAPMVWKARHEPGAQFLLAWLIPSWIAFEAVITKLPHYVLPLYPAIAILIAGILERDGLSTARWMVRGTIGWFFFPLVIAIAVLTGFIVFGGDLGLITWPFAAAAVISGLFAWRLYDVDGAERSLLRGMVASVFVAFTVYAVTFPMLPSLFPSALVADELRASGCAHSFMLPQHSHISEVYSINTADTRLTDQILDFVKAGK